MSVSRLRITIQGQVQGVNFRSEAVEFANGLDVRGFAKNIDDGTVQIVAEGEEAHLDEMLKWCHKGPAGAEITEVESIHEKPSGMYQSFQIQ